MALPGKINKKYLVSTKKLEDGRVKKIYDVDDDNRKSNRIRYHAF